MSWHTGGAVELRRRRLLGALALGGVAWGAGVGSSRVRGAVQGGGKPQYQGDAANTGYSPDECPPTANLQQAWEIAPEELQGTQTTLAAADGNLYACGYHRSSLICVAPTTGTIRWRWQTGYADSDFNAVSYPAVGGGTVYCGVSEPWPDSRPSVHGLVYALNASDGSERWRAGTGRGPAYPTLDGDSLYVGSQGALYVLATADGSGRWNHVPSDSDAFIGHPAVDGGTVYYTTDRGRLYALDTGGGSQRWASGVGAISAPSVVDGTVYVGRSGGVRALDAADGSGVWSASTAGPVGHAPAVADGTVFTFTVGPGDRETRDGVLNAFDSANGSRLWEFRTANVYSGPLPPLVVGDAVLVVGDPDETTYDNAVYVVDAASGSLRTQFGIHVDVGTAAPVVLDDTILVGDNSVGQGYLSAYTGTTQCSTSGGGGGTVHTLMIAANGSTDYVLTVDGTLEPDTVGGDFRAEGSDDTPEQNADGTLTASDGTGPAENPGGTDFYGDRFLFTGSVESLEVLPRSSSYDTFVYLDERDVSLGTVRGYDGGDTEHTLMVTANGPTDYVLTVDGTLEPDTVGGDFRAEGSDDTPERNADGTLTASDGTGPAENPGGANFHGDRFLLTGSVDRLDLSKADSSYEVNVYLDERLVSPADVLQLSG